MNLTKKINYKEEIEKIGDKAIWNMYYGDFKIGGKCNSPLHRDDDPSFSFYIGRYGGIKAKDFSLGETFSSVQFVMRLYNLSYTEACKKILDDFGVKSNNFSKKIINIDNIPVVKEEKSIKIITKPFSERELKYWREYGIEQESTLKLFNVYCVSKLYVNRQLFPLKTNELCFAYYFPKSNHLKIYKPLAKKKDKWMSNTSNLMDIQGYWQVNPKETKPELLVLTSSLKEVMFLYERGIKAMAIHGETANFEEDFIRHLKKYCKRIVSLYDIDKAGRISMEKLADKYDIQPIIMPGFQCNDFIAKDLTDSFLHCDKKEVELFVNSIKQLENN